MTVLCWTVVSCARRLLNRRRGMCRRSLVTRKPLQLAVESVDVARRGAWGVDGPAVRVGHGDVLTVDAVMVVAAEPGAVGGRGVSAVGPAPEGVVHFADMRGRVAAWPDTASVASHDGAAMLLGEGATRLADVEDLRIGSKDDPRDLTVTRDALHNRVGDGPVPSSQAGYPALRRASRSREVPSASDPPPPARCTPAAGPPTGNHAMDTPGHLCRHRSSPPDPPTRAPRPQPPADLAAPTGQPAELGRSEQLR